MGILSTQPSGLYIFAFGKITSSSHIVLRPLSLGPDRFSKKHCLGGGEEGDE